MKRSTSLPGALLLAAAVSLTACGTPPWQQDAEPSASESSTEPSPSPTSTPPSPTPAPTLGQIVNDLASGSTERTLTAGATTARVTYWSTLDMGSWTPDASKPVSLSLTATTDDDLAVVLSRLTVTPTVRDAQGGVLEAPAQFVDQASVQPGYAVADPQSYSTTFITGQLDPSAASLTLDISYELLVPTAPRSDSYAKQTATDTITIALEQVDEPS